jgi:transketolase
MPSFELFRAQDAAYQQKVLPPDVTVRVAIEAGNQQSWHEFLGANGRFVGVVDRFGASAPVERIYEALGLTPEAVAGAVLASMNS